MVIDFLALAKNRKTTYEFSDRKVDKQHILKILEAARWAPSSHNSQNWSFVVIQNQKKIEELINVCYYGGFHTTPNILIAVVMEPIYYDKKGLLNSKWLKDMAQIHQYMNISTPVMNMVYEAETLGMGTCILSPNIAKANKILGIPKEKDVVLMVGIGYPEKNAYRKNQTRKSLKSLVSYEKYGKHG